MESAARWAVVAAFLALSGCARYAHFEWGSYETFDAWFAGGAHEAEPSGLGFMALDGTFTGYVVNDIALRTPVYLVHDATRLAVAPFAATYYESKRLFGSSGPR